MSFSSCLSRTIYFGFSSAFIKIAPLFSLSLGGVILAYPLEVGAGLLSTELTLGLGGAETTGVETGFEATGVETDFESIVVETGLVATGEATWIVLEIGAATGAVT